MWGNTLSGLRAGVAALLAAGIMIMIPGAAGGHEFDHPAPGFSDGAPLASGLNAGGKGQWSLIDSFPTGNPHTDLDFFTSGGEMYLSAGTLAAGPNAGGQTLLKLTDGDVVDPSFVSAHPSASCISNVSAATGLQHDVEATPKGEVLFNTTQPDAVTSDAQLLLDATDAPGRCHDNNNAIAGIPPGGLEIVDITDPSNPVELALTSHIGQSHTVNVDPKRPHIALSVTSDTISLNPDGSRQNEDLGDSDRFDLDGFELVDLSSCMNFPANTSVADKRAACLPEVYRYRYPSSAIATGTEATGAVNGCHETEFYPDDKLSCASINVSMLFDISGAFDDNGTPDDYTDDKPNGTPLPCQVRGSSTLTPGFSTGAPVIDCVNGTGSGTEDLTVAQWLLDGAPSLEGVTIDGVAFHMGRGGGINSDANVDVSHEAELTTSGDHMLVTDERGGGVVPPGASCSPGANNPTGNGGVHAYATDRLDTSPPADTAEANDAYALGPDGKPAIFQAEPKTAPQATFCTAHVFQQIPGENRIVMGWYSQGTRVVDYFENPDGTVVFEEVGHFIPENAETWTSAIFKIEKDDKTGDTTYYGATGDFGRATVDIYKVTFPGTAAPPNPPSPPGSDPDGRCKLLYMGTDNDDSFVGTRRGERFRGNNGADDIKGRAGDDCLIGGGGKDRLNGGSGSDVVKGGRGKDILIGGPDADKVSGNKGGDLVRGRGGDDTLRGGKHPDRIKGDGGDDAINVRGGGVDRVNCGKGIDVVKAGPRDKVSKAGCERVRRPR